MPSRSRRLPVSTDRRFRKKSPSSDFGPAFRWQHSPCVYEPTERAGVLAARALETHVVDSLVTRKMLSPRQSEAALKFRLDFQRAAMSAHVVSNYSPVRGNKDYFFGARGRDDREEAAYRRWRNAVREMGLHFSGVVISTVCHDLLPAPCDIPALRRGLEKLGDWYRLPEQGNA